MTGSGASIAELVVSGSWHDADRDGREAIATDAGHEEDVMEEEEGEGSEGRERRGERKARGEVPSVL